MSTKTQAVPKSMQPGSKEHVSCYISTPPLTYTHMLARLKAQHNKLALTTTTAKQHTKMMNNKTPKQQENI